MTPISIKRRAFLIFEHILILVVVLAVLFPIFWLVLSAFKTRVDVFSLKLFFEPTLDNFRMVLFEPHHFTKHLLNSVVIAGMSTIVGLGISFPAAYGFSRFRIKGGGGIMFAILFLQFLPAVIFIVPLYATFRSLGLLDTHLALILSYLLVTIPFSIWILKTYIDSMPVEMEQAALVDGATHTQAIWHVLVPVAMPGVVVAVILSFIMTFNEFLFALVLTNRDAVTLPIALIMLNPSEGILWERMAAVSVLMMIPMVTMAYFVQRHLAQGLSAGGVKA
ncbi:MAG: carbohydrate ABC transporter permease [Albidovulum sp.]|nr:carbohydrate ABC transporter permease [Albidovulum sp.]